MHKTLAMDAELQRLKQSNIKLKKKIKQLMSEQRQMNNQIQAAREKCRLLAHDLKSPITGIKLISESFLDEMIEDEVQPDKEYLTSQLEKVLNLSGKMHRMVRLFLEEDHGNDKDFHEIVPRPSEVLLQDVVQSVLYQFEQIATKKEISFQVDPAIRSGISWFADPDLIDLVLCNILSNAIKYSPRKNQVELCVERCPEWVKLHVIDQGVGLTEDDISNLFQSYAQISSLPTGSESKTGLGLYLAKQMAVRMGGDLIAASAGAGRGTTLTIMLPSSR
ncbi:MAG: HAMP domain-containing sensor histidine kinase [Chloroflexota bacterium]